MSDLPLEVIRNFPAWKRKYGDIFLWSTGSLLTVYRGVTFQELEDYQEMVDKDPTEAEEFLIKVAVLYPEEELDLDSLPVSVVANLSSKILEAGKLHDEGFFFEKLNKARAHAQTYQGLGIALISHAFNIDPDDVNCFTLDKFTRYFALAEVALQREFTPAQKKKKRPRGFLPAGVIDPSPPPVPAQDKIDFGAENAALYKFGAASDPRIGI